MTTVTEKMLINATHPEEIRVAMVKDNYLFDLDIEKSGVEKKKGNTYKGRITRVEPSLEAAFVEYGAKRQGFLPLKEISPEYFLMQPPAGSKHNIKDLVKEGQELLVQIDKEERGNKGAALTTYITLAGCYLVFMPNNPQAGGISRRIEGEQRDELREVLQQLDVPDGSSLIVRTAGMGKNIEDLQWDLDFLKRQWQAILFAFRDQPSPCLIYQEGDVIIRSIRDNLRRSIQEIIIDDQEVFAKARNYLETVRPDFVQRLKLYQDNIPLFNRFNIESQIETAFQREVLLPSGGSIVIDRTEALVSIDINSAKATGGGDIEETALNTNREAAHEIARQLRIRDLGGLVVIDFIDMGPIRNQREVEFQLREALKNDRARVQIGRISRFGLLEMSRQRLQTAIGESHQQVCPRCNGRGTIRGIESLGMSLLRLAEEEAIKPHTGCVQVQAPVETATYMMNEMRNAFNAIEKRHNVKMLIIPNPYIEVPEFKIDRIDQRNVPSQQDNASYQSISKPELHVQQRPEVPATEPTKAAISHITPPSRQESKQPSLLQRIVNGLFGSSSSSKPESKPAPKAKRPQSQRGGKGSGNRGGRQQQSRRGGGPQQGSRSRGGRGSSSQSGQQRRRNNQQQSGYRRSQQSQGGGSNRNRSQQNQNSSNKEPADN